MTKPDVASTLACSFSQVRISSDLCMLLRWPLDRIPQIEKMRSTKAYEAGYWGQKVEGGSLLTKQHI